MWSLSVVHQLFGHLAGQQEVMKWWLGGTRFGLAKVSVVLTCMLPSEMDSSYFISAASCEEGHGGKNK